MEGTADTVVPVAQLPPLKVPSSTACSPMRLLVKEELVEREVWAFSQTALVWKHIVNF